MIQDGFKSQRIETDAYLIEAVRYVHNNPVSGDREPLMAFHALEDEQEHPEIKEDLIRQREEKVQKIITEICGRNGIIEVAQLHSRPEAINEMIRRLADGSGLSYRKIAEMTGVSCTRVSDVAKNTKKPHYERFKNQKEPSLAIPKTIAFGVQTKPSPAIQKILF